MRAEQLAKATKDLMLAEPFYGMFLIMLNKQWNNKKVPTAGVGLNGINYQLYLNEDFWDGLTESTRIGLLKHELLHIGFFHLTEFSSLEDRLLSNIAEDLEINQYINASNLPPGGQMIEDYPELKLEPKKGTLYYYERLKQGKKDGSCPNLNAMIAADAMKQITVVIRSGKGGEKTVHVPDHSSWSDFKDLPEATQKMIQAQTEHLLKEVADQIQKSRGTIPGEFAEILKRIETKEPPKFDWKAYLRRFTGGSQIVFTKKSRRKVNKRYEDNPGLKLKPKRHILVALDTSGSVSTEELKEFLHEMYHMQKTGSEVTVVEADAAISHIEKFDHKKDFNIHGRGGTDFQPVIDYYNANLGKYTCLVYFTDGEAPAPSKAHGKMLWVLSSTSQINEALIGPQIKLS